MSQAQLQVRVFPLDNKRRDAGGQEVKEQLDLLQDNCSESAPDIRKEDEEEETFIRKIIQPFNPTFNAASFFRYTIYHFIYFLVLGPFIIILRPIIGAHRLNNMMFTDLTITCYL